MCGILGYVLKQNINLNKEKFLNNIKTLERRGPDDSGHYIENLENFNIYLGHRRLSIIDLNKRSSQPF